MIRPYQTHCDDIFITQKIFDCFNFERLVLSYTEYNIDSYNPSLFDSFNILAPVELKKSVHKRQAEFLAGRYTARLGLRAFNVADDFIVSSKNRAPIWPIDMVGSISHTSTKAMTAIGMKDDFEYIGIDIETIITESDYVNILDLILVKNEHRWLTPNSALLLTIIFSAKESLFKALYPLVNIYFDFVDAQIIDIDLEEGTFTLELLKTLNDSFRSGAVFKGQYAQLEDSVVTLIAH